MARPLFLCIGVGEKTFPYPNTKGKKSGLATRDYCIPTTEIVSKFSYISSIQGWSGHSALFSGTGMFYPLHSIYEQRAASIRSASAINPATTETIDN